MGAGDLLREKIHSCSVIALWLRISRKLMINQINLLRFEVFRTQEELPLRARSQSSMLKIRCAHTLFKLILLVTVKHSLISSLNGILNL